MYEKYWGLQEKPFENTPDPRFLFHSDDIAEVFKRLLYALKNNRGAAMLTGVSGCGKTLMARVTYHVLKEIIDLRNSHFDRKLIKALINIVSIFSLGSLVKLNNGEVGRVIRTSRMHPTRPTVEVLLDPQAQKVNPPRRVDLEDEPMLYIVDPAIDEAVLK